MGEDKIGKKVIDKIKPHTQDEQTLQVKPL